MCCRCEIVLIIGVILLQKILEEKIIRTHYLSSYYCHFVSKIMHQLI